MKSFSVTYVDRCPSDVIGIELNDFSFGRRDDEKRRFVLSHRSAIEVEGKCLKKRRFVKIIWAKPGLFYVHFGPFLVTLTHLVQLTIDGKRLDGVLGIQTHERRI